MDEVYWIVQDNQIFKIQNMTALMNVEDKQTGVNVAYLVSRSGSCSSRRRLEVGDSQTDATSGCEITLCPNRELKQ